MDKQASGASNKENAGVKENAEGREEHGDKLPKVVVKFIEEIHSEIKKKSSDVQSELGTEKDELGNERDESGNERDELGNERDELGNERDELGNERDESGNERDELENEREELENEKDISQSKKEESQYEMHVKFQDEIVDDIDEESVHVKDEILFHDPFNDINESFDETNFAERNTPYVEISEAYFKTDEPHIGSKEPYVETNKLYVQTREPCTETNYDEPGEEFEENDVKILYKYESDQESYDESEHKVISEIIIKTENISPDPGADCSSASSGENTALETLSEDDPSDWIYICEICGFEATSPKVLSNHRRHHLPDKVCVICGKAVAHISFSRHMKTHDEDGRTKNSARRYNQATSIVTNKRFKSQNERGMCQNINGMSQNIEDTLKDLKEECLDEPQDLCESQQLHEPHGLGVTQTTENKSQQIRGTSQTEENPCFPCTQCMFVGETSKQLKSHLMAHQPKVKCNICGILISPLGIGRHRRMHKEEAFSESEKIKFSCQKCDFETSDIKRIKVHDSRVHNKATCSICGLAIASIYLKKHMVTHSTETVTCPDCGKVSKNSESYKFHRYFHIPQDNTCDVCDRQFSTKGAFLRHQKLHKAKKRSYICDICAREFNNKNTLDKHIRSHRGERPYSCDVCQKKLSSTNALKIHKRLHTKEKPYVCEICLAAFAQTSLLRTHMKNKHDIELPRRKN